jgi:hypothetical protein
MKARQPIVIVLFSIFLATMASAQSGSWTKKANAISGTWEIVKDGSGHKLKLKGFKTKSAPDLKLFLSPKELGSLSGKNATSGAVRIAKLQSAKGDQEYAIPASVDLSKFKTLILQCEQYSKLWGGGSL